MSFIRGCVYASFAGGVLALSFQLSGGAHAATPSPILLVADQSSSSSQDGQRDSRRGRTGPADAESSGKMQSEKDAASGGGKMNPNSKMDGKFGRGQGGEIDPGIPTPSIPSSSGVPSSSGASTSGDGSGMSSGGAGGGGR